MPTYLGDIVFNSTLTTSSATTFSDEYSVNSVDTSVESAGSNQANATLLASTYNIIDDTGAAGEGVRLPASQPAGTEITVINSGTMEIFVYPATGGYIDGLAQNAYKPLYFGSVQTYVSKGSEYWASTRAGSRYVGRTSHADTDDWANTGSTYGTLTWDSTTRDLPSLSSILPKSCSNLPVHFYAYVAGDTSGSEALRLFPKSGGSVLHGGISYSQSIGAAENRHVTCPLTTISDASAEISYYGAQTGLLAYLLTVIGFWVLN